MPGVSDAYAQDNHQFLLAHIYTYMVENNLKESAMQLFNETSVPCNPNFHVFTSTLPPTDTCEHFLWDWWLSLWTLIAQTNPHQDQTLAHLCTTSQIYNQYTSHTTREQTTIPTAPQEPLQDLLYEQFERDRSRFIKEREAVRQQMLTRPVQSTRSTLPILVGGKPLNNWNGESYPG